MRWGGEGGGPSVTRGDQILLEQTVRGDHLSRGTINFVTDPMKVPDDRNPCLTFIAAEKKPASRFMKKGEVLEDTHEIPQRGS